MFSKSVAILFLLGLSFLFLEQRIDLWLIASYFTLSLFMFLLYGVDKYNAIKGRGRISERTLQIGTLLGGWPGALMAQQFFRHKTKKRPFIIVLWLSILINFVGVGYFQYFNF